MSRFSGRIRAFAARIGQTITVTVSPERFTFASKKREALVDTTLRVAPNGRIVGFGESERSGEAQRLPLFGPGQGEVNEEALIVFCRRGLSLALGPWGIVRPRVVVRGVDRLSVSPELLARALLAAGAATVEFAR